jgi:hypothetical protein
MSGFCLLYDNFYVFANTPAVTIISKNKFFLQRIEQLSFYKSPQMENKTLLQMIESNTIGSQILKLYLSL